MIKKLPLLLLALLFNTASHAALVSIAPSSVYNPDTAAMDSALGITGMIIEDFEDESLAPGLSIEYLNPNNGPLTTLPTTYIDGSNVFNTNSWDGPGALVNTFNNIIWCCGGDSDLNDISQRITFDVGSVDFFGVGLGNFQQDLVDHALLVNGVEVVAALESLANFTTGISLRNGYLKIEAESGEAINTVAFELRENGTSIPIENIGDGLIFDHLAIGNSVSSIPVPAAFWLFGTALVGLVGFSRRKKTS